MFFILYKYFNINRMELYKIIYLFNYLLKIKINKLFYFFK